MSLSKLREIVKDKEGWRAAVHGVAKSRTNLVSGQQQDENSGANGAKGMVPSRILCGVGEFSRSHASLMTCYFLLCSLVKVRRSAEIQRDRNKLPDGHRAKVLCKGQSQQWWGEDCGCGHPCKRLTSICECVWSVSREVGFWVMWFRWIPERSANSLSLMWEVDYHDYRNYHPHACTQDMRLRRLCEVRGGWGLVSIPKHQWEADHTQGGQCKQTTREAGNWEAWRRGGKGPVTVERTDQDTGQRRGPDLILREEPGSKSREGAPQNGATLHTQGRAAGWVQVTSSS